MIKHYSTEMLEPFYMEDQSKLKTLKLEVETLFFNKISSAAAANALMVWAGHFNPLKGFMNL